YAAFAAGGVLVFSSCETGKTARALPAYESPLPRSDFQNVHMTAYTHTESDHTEYGARNALGGQLQAAGPAIHRAENVARALAISDEENGEVRRVSNAGTGPQPFSMEETSTNTRVTTPTRVTKTTRGAKRAIA